MLLINYDIYALITAIRCNYEKESFIPMLNVIIKYLEKSSLDNGLKMNSVRSLIKPFPNEQTEMLKWVFVDNYYTAIKEKNSDKITSLTDAVHNIPCTLVDELKPEKRIVSEITEYRKRYNNEFLRSELKAIQ